MIMGNSEDFQRQFTCLMKNLMHSAVTETTKLFESTVHEMRTELMQRKQNDRIKDNVTICSEQGGCMRNCKDIGIQCVVSSSPAEESRIPSSQHEDEDKTRFSDLFPGFPPEENGQFTLVFIKPEEPDMCDYTPACLLPKVAGKQPFVVQRIEAPIINQEAEQFLGRLSPYQGLSDHPFTHNHSASPPPHPLVTPQSQESNPPDNPYASLELMPDRLEENPVTPLQPLAPTATSSQADVANGRTSASPEHGDQPRRLSARKSKSVYRRLVTLETAQLGAENIPKTNDTCSPICHVPAESHKETDKKSSEQLISNQTKMIDKNQNEGQQPGITQKLKNQCEVCELVLSSASALRHHWKVHGAGKDSVCYMCGKIFPNDRSLKSHLLIHTMGKHNHCSDDEGTEANGEMDQEILGLQQNSAQDQPRRLSARKSKSVYRRPVDLKSPRPSVDIFQQTNDTSSSTCLVPTNVLKKTDNNFKCVSRDQPDKNQDDKLLIDQRQKNQCEVCGLALNSASALKQHWNVHRTDTDSVCYWCGKIFPNDRSLRCHEFIHTMGKPHSEDEAMPKTEQTECKIDQEVLGLYPNTHQDQPRRFSARKSKSIYRRPVDLVTTQPRVENVWQTQRPGVSTYHIATEVHKRTDRKNFRPPSKSKSYKNQQGSIHRHKNQCELCGRILCSASSLLHHLRLHYGERPFVCDRCGKAFAYQKGLRRHLQEVHKKISGDPSGIQANKHQCGICGTSLISAASLLFHQRVHRERSFACDQCGKTFPDEQDLRRHTVIHTRDKRYQCLQCGRTFPYRCLLARHQIEHTGERPFPCGLCGKRFASRVSKAIHTRVHAGERPHRCTLCNKTFTKKALLKAHMLKHREEKPFSCLTCGKRFGYRNSLKIHERIHTGEKPYDCKMCGKSFRQSANLRYHVSKQHISLSQSAAKSL